MALLLPTHFFYAFLYYTDVGGVTLVLACYLVSAPALQVPGTTDYSLSDIMY